MTTPDMGNVPIEDDPTGMRALLSSLPDPGPMPEDLSARILAALEREARYAESGSIWDEEPAPEVPAVPAGPAHQEYADGATVVPLRRRSRALPLLAAAAAIAVVGVGGGTLVKALIGGMNGSSSTSAGATLSGPRQANESATERNSDSAAGGGTSSASSSGSVTMSGTGAASGYDALSGFAVSASGTAYTVDKLAPQAAELMATRITQNATTPAGGLAVEEAARGCAQGLGAAPDAPLRVDFGSFEAGAAVLIVTEVQGEARAYVVTENCSAADPQILAGPVTLP